MMTNKDQQHTRVNKALLSTLERSTLAWFSKRMPSWVTPDKLTFFGFLGTLLIGVSYYLTNQNPAFLWLASLGLVINWFGDSLDGTLARFRKIERPRYGFFIDHVIDGLGEVIIMVGIGASPYVDFRIAMVALVGYLLLGNLVYILTYVRNEFRISYAGLSPTEVRLILILTNALVFFFGNTKVQTGFGLYSVYDFVIIALILLLFSIYLVMTYVNAKQIAQEEVMARQK
jgi:phosphatidylglycerophosphate synthase